MRRHNTVPSRSLRIRLVAYDTVWKGTGNKEIGYRSPCRRPRLPVEDLAEQAVNALLETNKGALVNGETVSLPEFGTFSTRSRSARRRRNPRTRESIVIAASKTPSLKAGKTLRYAVR
ncbi:MAG: hypothetical protein F4056_07620 [Chloroflexi bacterium]|nr:hypothetical protein [Nitrospinota bacterium]MYI83147.1 hypothetical protein [Chloroflexota bacterium]